MLSNSSHYAKTNKFIDFATDGSAIMKHSLIFLLLSVLLISCTTPRTPPTTTNWTQENWRQSLQTDPAPWVQGADKWFVDGDPYTPLADRKAPGDAAMSKMSVQVPDFTIIQTNGGFQLQIFGGVEHNSIEVYGPNEAIRSIAIKTDGDTLYLQQQPEAPASVQNVIVRIGIKQLSRLIQQQQGCGTIEGIRIQSTCLDVFANGSGNIWLAGNINLRAVKNGGIATVTVFNVNSSSVALTTSNWGSINVSGRVGVRTIEHHGNNDINVIGADAVELGINADGSGKVGVTGESIHLNNVIAKGKTCVYVNSVMSQSVHAWVFGKARMGLAGASNNIRIDTMNDGLFFGRDLCSQNAFARSAGSSHINFTANKRAFAAARDASSIYFFGEPNILSPFVGNNAKVMTFPGNEYCRCYFEGQMAPRAKISYKGETMR